MLGVHLGAALKSAFPTFHPVSYHSRNLRQFIRTHVPAVSEMRRSGQDVLYAVADATKANVDVITSQVRHAGLDFSPLPTTAYNWKAYSNPGYPFFIAANRETGALQPFPQGSTPGSPWVVIPKPTGDFHHQLAKEFVAGLAEPSRTNLGALLHDPKWYVRFSLVADKNNFGTQWSAFRRAKLIENFNSALRELGIPAPQAMAYLKTTTGLSAQAPTSNLASVPPKSEEEPDFRALVRDVVCVLPLDELRALKLPVGAVFDALRRK